MALVLILHFSTFCVNLVLVPNIDVAIMWDRVQRQGELLEQKLTFFSSYIFCLYFLFSRLIYIFDYYSTCIHFGSYLVLTLLGYGICYFSYYLLIFLLFYDLFSYKYFTFISLAFIPFYIKLAHCILLWAMVWLISWYDKVGAIMNQKPGCQKFI